MSQKIQVGQIIEGTVTGIKPFGAFVSIDETTQGLVHISHVTHGYLADINEVLKVGDQVKVKVLAIDEEKGKISLSIKETQDKPRHNTTKPKKQANTVEHFEDLMKDFLKGSNDRQADINRRLNR